MTCRKGKNRECLRETCCLNGFAIPGCLCCNHSRSPSEKEVPHVPLPHASVVFRIYRYWKASRNTSTTLTTTRNIMMRKTTTRCVSGSMLQRRSVWRRPGLGLTLFTQLRAMRTLTLSIQTPVLGSSLLPSSFLSSRPFFLLFQPRCQENPNLTSKISLILLFMLYSSGLSLACLFFFICRSIPPSPPLTQTRYDGGTSPPWLCFLL